jgi:hypothetical protein
MAENKNQSDSGVISRLAGRGEDALTRLMDELGRNPRVTDAVERTMAAKGKVDETTRKTLGQVGLAAAGEIRDLRKRLEQLEKRLGQLEGTGGSSSGSSGRKAATSTKSSGGTAKSSSSRSKTSSASSAKSSSGRSSTSRSKSSGSSSSKPKPSG